MATKIPDAPMDAHDAAAVADDLTVLHPDRALALGGREVTLREYGFFEGLEIADRASAFLADLTAASDAGALRYAHVRRLFGRHRAVIPSIAAQAGDVELAWLETLASDEMELYLATWFAVNAGFFVREVLAAARERAFLEASASVGAMSSSGSPPPASAISSDSAA